MKVLGLMLALAGWIVPVAGLTFTDSMTARLILCALGMTSCVVGILGFLNGAHLKQALWKK
jgi:hypothetical protein